MVWSAYVTIMVSAMKCRPQLYQITAVPNSRWNFDLCSVLRFIAIRFLHSHLFCLTNQYTTGSHDYERLSVARWNWLNVTEIPKIITKSSAPISSPMTVITRNSRVPNGSRVSIPITCKCPGTKRVGKVQEFRLSDLHNAFLFPTLILHEFPLSELWLEFIMEHAHWQLLSLVS